MNIRGLRLAGLVVAALLLTACDPAPSGSSTPSPAVESPTAAAAPSPVETPPAPAPVVPVPAPAPAASGTALAALDRMRVAGRGAKTGYSRAQFGPAWADTDRNGCDTRNDVLIRDLRDRTYKAGTSGCVVTSGVLPDPYTGRRITFVRGGAAEVDIDHVVALGNAWVTGASSWAPARRLALANDPLNLLAVDSSANRQKGDGDAATWLPPNTGFRCTYVARQIGVKSKYGLYVTAAEKDAMQAVLARCPTQVLPTGGNATESDLPFTAPAAPASARKPTTTSKKSAGTDPRFATCKAAKAAGYGPYVKGKDPEYAWYRDADSDGIDCE